MPTPHVETRLLVAFHPDTTCPLPPVEQIVPMLKAIRDVGLPATWLLPNNDAGSNRMRAAVERFYTAINRRGEHQIHLYLTPTDYLRALRDCTVAVGNSSGFARDAGIFGTPVVLIGDRQRGRETAVNVCRIPGTSADLIRKTILRAIRSGRKTKSNLYGEPGVSDKIVTWLINHYMSKDKATPPVGRCGNTFAQ